MDHFEFGSVLLSLKAVVDVLFELLVGCRDALYVIPKRPCSVCKTLRAGLRRSPCSKKFKTPEQINLFYVPSSGNQGICTGCIIGCLGGGKNVSEFLEE